MKVQNRLYIYFKVPNTILRSTLKKIIDSNNIDLEFPVKFVFYECDYEVWPSGKIICSHQNRIELQKSIKKFRENFSRISGHSLEILFWSYEEKGKVKFEIKNLHQYQLLFIAESKDIIYLVNKLDRKYYKNPNTNYIHVLSDYATYELVKFLKIDNFNRALKYVVMDVERMRKIYANMGTLYQQLNLKAKATIQSNQSSALKKIFTKENVKYTISGILLGVIANAIFHYIFQYIVQIITRQHFQMISPSKIKFHEICKSMPELQYIFENSECTLEKISQAVKKPEWEIALILNQLVSKGIITKSIQSHETSYHVASQCH